MAAPCSSLLLLGAYYYTWYGVGEQWQVFPRPFEPTMGEYRSADASVMRQHHAWARHACIDFFAVSWQHILKSTLRYCLYIVRVLGL
jgi:hypothetical protein